MWFRFLRYAVTIAVALPIAIAAATPDLPF